MALDSAVISPVNVDNSEIDIYADDLELYIAEFLEDIGVEDGAKMPSTQWAACMQYVGYKTFKRDNSGLLALERGFPVPNDYNPFAVMELVERYVFLCNRYNQRVCIDHFCKLSCIHPDTIYRWKDDHRRLYSNNKACGIDSGYRVTIARADIYKRLVNSTIENADDIMLSRSGVNSIAYKNGVIERYGTGAGRASDTADFADMALQLGISDQLGLPGD